MFLLGSDPNWILLSSGFVAGFVAHFVWRHAGKAKHLPLTIAVLILIIILAGLRALGSEDVYQRAPTTVIGIAAFFLLIQWAPPVFSDFLRSGPLCWLGRVSFSVYLLHYPIMWTTSAALTRGHVSTDNVWLWLVVGLTGGGGTLLIAPLSYRCIEKPACALGAALSGMVQLSAFAREDVSRQPRPYEALAAEEPGPSGDGAT